MSAVLIARCTNYREDRDQPCTGTIEYRWGYTQGRCDTCGGFEGIAVASWLRVEAAESTATLCTARHDVHEDGVTATWSCQQVGAHGIHKDSQGRGWQS